MNGDFEGVRPRSSRGLASGGDMRLAMDGSRAMLDGSSEGGDDGDVDERW